MSGFFGRRSSAWLSDGREIVFYDESSGARRIVEDRRGLAPVVAASEIRHDPLRDEWVAIAGHRQDRTFLPPTGECPLCPTRAGRETEVPAADYDVVVFENRFPSFAGVGEPAAGCQHGGHTDVQCPYGPHADIPAAPLAARRGAAGRCEVVCFTSDHEGSFARLSPRRARLVVDVWADRTAVLGGLPGVEQVFCFENRGAEIGVTLQHPHGQIYGYPFVTPHTRRHLQVAGRYRDRTGRDLHADVLAEERAAGERVVVDGAYWTAYVPAAARWPVEVHVVPHRAVPDLPALDDAERDELAAVLLDVFGRLDALYPGGGRAKELPYLACWYQAPVRSGRDLVRVHLQVLSPQRPAGRLKYLAGSESGMGVFIGDVLPEDVAARLRAARP